MLASTHDSKLITLTNKNVESGVSQLRVLVRKLIFEEIDVTLEVNIALLYRFVHELHHYMLDMVTVNAYREKTYELINHLRKYSYPGLSEEKLSSVKLQSQLTMVVELAEQIMNLIEPTIELQNKYVERINSLTMLTLWAQTNIHPSQIKCFYITFLSPCFAFIKKVITSIEAEEKMEPTSCSSTEVINKQQNKRHRAREDYKEAYALMEDQISTLVVIRNGKDTMKTISAIDENLILIIELLKILNHAGIYDENLNMIEKIRKDWSVLTNHSTYLNRYIDIKFDELMKTPMGYYLYHIRKFYTTDTKKPIEIKEKNGTGLFAQDIFLEFLQDTKISHELRFKAEFHWQALKRSSKLEVLAMLLSNSDYAIFYEDLSKIVATKWFTSTMMRSTPIVTSSLSFHTQSSGTLFPTASTSDKKEIKHVTVPVHSL